MALDEQLTALFAQTIGWAQPVGHPSLYGDQTWGTAVDKLARVEPVSRTLRDQNGNDVVTNYRLFLTFSVGMRDRIWLPGDSKTDATKAHTPKMIKACAGEDGTVLHYEVYF